LKETPITITASHSPRSAGACTTFFRRRLLVAGPQDPGGPYIQRDGNDKSGQFRRAPPRLMRLSVQVPALAAALDDHGKTNDTRRMPRVTCAHGFWIRQPE